MEPFYINYRVVELIELKTQCETFNKILQLYLYLDSITEGTIWEFYGAAVESAGDEPFLDFTQDNKDTFHRLKLRSLEERLAKMSHNFNGNSNP